MKAQFDNKAASSFLLWTNHVLQDDGEAYINHNSYFYPVNTLYNGYYTYASPFNQFVSDSSVPGAVIMSGVYLDNVFITTGQSGFHNINYERGQIYFSSEITGSNRLSGQFSLKEFNVQLTEEPEEKLLFETKFSHKPRIGQTITGLNSDQFSYPAIFIKLQGGNNEPFAFGGEELSKLTFTSIVFADNEFNLHAVCSLFKDTARDYIPVFEENQMPYNVFGGFKSGVYNYDTIVSGKLNENNCLYIKDVSVGKFNSQIMSEVQNANPGVYAATIDFRVEKNRFPRL